MMFGHQWLRSAVAICLLAVSSGLFADDPKSSPMTRSTLFLRHPHAGALLKEVSLTGGEMSLREFARFLQEKSGVNVIFNEQELEEESNELDQDQPVPELKGVTLLTAARLYLDQMNGALIEEPQRLVITTKTAALADRPRVLFWVGDLVSADPKFDPEDLREPVFERQESIQNRYATKLKKLTSWKLNNASIKDLAAKLRTELGENVLIELDRLIEERVDPAAGQISCNYENMPLDNILREVLLKLNLCHVIEHEVLKITTCTVGIAKRTLRVYRAQGLVFRDVHPGRTEFMTGGPQWNEPGIGWLGNYGGGFGGLGPFGSFGNQGHHFSEFGGRYVRFRYPEFPPAPVDKPNGAAEGAKAPDATKSSLPPTADNVDRPLPVPVASPFVEDTAYSLLNDILTHTGGRPDDVWEYGIDGGLGGALSMYYPSQAIVVKQTANAHAQIASYLQQKRELQAQRGTNPSMVALTAKDAAARPEKASFALITLIKDLAGGPPDGAWSTDSGPSNGTLTYDNAHFALTIRQSPDALDEIAGLLVQLRRERYALMHNARPWEQDAVIDRQAGVIDKSPE